MSTTEKKLFKDWFDAEAASLLGRQLQTACPALDLETFTKSATQHLETLEMNARVAQFSEAMAATLPENKKQALEILIKSLPEPQKGTEQITDGWLLWPVGKFIADYGPPHFDTAMTAMIELTKRFTSEFAVRPFVEEMPDQTFARLYKLTDDPNPHVRRWCSEGTRPLLPWGKKLHELVADPSPSWRILEALKDDPSLYVQKSVGNHLNDISKNHPKLVIKRCAEWLKDATPQRKWIINRGLRTLIKDGNRGALKLLGYVPPKKLEASLELKPETISIGQLTVLKLELTNHHSRSQNLLIDYAVTYVRKQKRIGRKVFKWKTCEIAKGETVKLQKKHPMKLTTTRTLYPGVHDVEILVNGVSVAKDGFQLKGA